MILASGRGLAHALGGRSGRVVQVHQRSWGVPGNLDAQQFDGGPASKIDVGKAAAGARGRERIERIAPKGCGCDAASLRGRGGV